MDTHEEKYRGTRDIIRSAILDSKPTQVLVTAFGVQIEVKAPDLEGLLQYRNVQDDDTIMARQLINTCFVPNTDEKVFDEADVASLMRVKFTPDMKRLVGAINKVLGGDEAIDEAVNQESFRNQT